MKKGYKLSDLAARLDLKIEDSSCKDRWITGVNTLEDAGPEEVSFLANPKYARFLHETKAGAVIVHPDAAGKVPCAIVSENPYLDFARLLAVFAKKEGEFTGISPLAFIHETANVDASCTVYPFVYVGPRANVAAGCSLFSGVYLGEDVKVGPDTVIYPNVVVMACSQIGAGCIIHAGTVIGSDGFGFVPGASGIEKVPQTGSVLIGNDVEIGANTAIDRAALGNTIIGNGTKIDNLVQVGHNVKVGENCLLVAQVGIAGSVIIGNQVTLAGQAGISGHIKLGDNAVVGPQAGLGRNLANGEVVGGSPAIPRADFLRSSVLQGKLPNIYSRLKKVENALKAMEVVLK